MHADFVGAFFSCRKSTLAGKIVLTSSSATAKSDREREVRNLLLSPFQMLTIATTSGVIHGIHTM